MIEKEVGGGWDNRIMDEDAIEELMNVEAGVDLPVLHMDCVWWRVGDWLPSRTNPLCGPSG